MASRKRGVARERGITARIGLAHSLIQRALAVRTVERKRRHVDFEPLALCAFHLVTAGHEAGWGLKRDATGVFEPLAGSEHRLLSYHAFAADFLPVSGAVGDERTPRSSFPGLFAGVRVDFCVRPITNHVFCQEQ